MFLIQQKEVTDQPSTQKQTAPKKRFLGLDALRGIAIIGMVFSGVFPHEDPWPGFMFHAQVGPPNFVYTPDVPGITWVDLVFPFFLFAMGAAFPLAMRRKVDHGGVQAALPGLLKRGVLLVLFAVIMRNLNWFDLQGPGWINQLTSLITFGCFFLVFMRFNSIKKEWLFKTIGLLVMTVLIILHHTYTDFNFNKGRNDIIIVVLANMAVVGGLIWVLTKDNINLRMGIMALFAAIWFTHAIDGSWTKYLWDFHPSLRWMYHFSYLKYLCIVLPGSVLGDMLLKHSTPGSVTSKKALWSLSLIGFLIIVVNLYGLYTRQILLNLGLTLTLLLVGGLLIRNWRTQINRLYVQIYGWGSFFIILGLFIEPLDGGIKKDPSSFSYWFLTSGLAFLTFIICQTLSEGLDRNVFWNSIIRSGQNPMVAYVATAFLISPILALTSLAGVFDYLHDQHFALGLVKTFFITTMVVVVTSYTVTKKWFWKT